MTRMDERAVARKLAERDDIEPPAGLLERIQSEIPDEIRVSPELARSIGAAPDAAGMPPRQRWLLAASLVAALGAGVLGWELRGRVPAMGISGAEEAEREAPAAREAVEDAAGDAAGGAAPLALKQAPAAPEAAPEASMAAEALPAEPRQVPPAPVERPEEEPELEALPVPQRQREQLRDLGSVAPPVATPRDRGWERDDARIAAPMAAPAAPAAPPPPPRPETAEAHPGFLLEEEITVTAAASLAESVTLGSTVVYRRPGGRSPDTFVDTHAAPLSSFELNVGTSSYEEARRSLGDGRLPDPGSVRVEEWVSSFHYGDRAPLRVDFHVKAEGAPTPFTPGPRYRLVRFNVRAREAEPRNRGIADQATAEVEWNPTVVESYRILGFENRADERVRAGAEIQAGQSVTALYEIKLRSGAMEDADRRLATLRLRWRSAETGRIAKSDTPLMGFHLASGWESASPALRLAAVVAETAEILQGSAWARDGSLNRVYFEARNVAARFPGNESVAELVSLVREALRLKGMAVTEPRRSAPPSPSPPPSEP